MRYLQDEVFGANLHWLDEPVLAATLNGLGVDDYLLEWWFLPNGSSRPITLRQQARVELKRGQLILVLYLF